jgi:2-dehydro-3-deoxy-D-gluconate aldolase
MTELKGIITPTITPMVKDNVDYDAIDSLLDFLAKIGVNGIFPMGSTGVFPIVSVELQVKILEYFMDKKKEGMYFLAGVGRNSLDETLTMASYAKELGADGLSIVTPYYVRMSQDSLYDYYERLLKEIDIPILIYNIPQNTNNNIAPETVYRLKSQFSHLVGIKDSSGNFSTFSSFIDMLGKDFRILQGQDDLLLPSLMMGASGGICGTSNFVDLSVMVYKEFTNSNTEKARKIQSVLTELKRYVNTFDFPQAYIAEFIERIFKRETSSVFPLRDYPPEIRKSIAEKTDQILKKLGT